MRTKLYYSPDEINEYLYTSGSEWMIESDYTEYFGFYHTYSNGDVYTLGTFDSTLSKKLIPFEDMTANEKLYSRLKPKQQTRYKTTIIPHRPQITQEQIRQGSFTRYFIQKHNETSIIEISETQYGDINKKIIDPNMYRIAILQWYISGPTVTTQTGTVRNLSVQQKNAQQIEFAKQSIRNIHFKLTNLLEFYTDTTYEVPRDINA